MIPYVGMQATPLLNTVNIWIIQIEQPFYTTSVSSFDMKIVMIQDHFYSCCGIMTYVPSQMD